MINTLDSLLHDEEPLYQVAHKNAGYYYQMPDVTFTQSSQYLYLSIKIPISSTAVYLDIYSIVSLPQPLSGNNHNTTKLVNIKPYFAISRDGSFYAEFDRILPPALVKVYSNVQVY